MLTTPAMASEPYSDDAPSSSTSMRSTMASGMVLRSVAAPTPDADDSLTQRMPSTSTSTRLAPRWRRSTCAEPAPTPLPSGGKPKLPDELNLALSAEPEPVSCCSTSLIEFRPVRSMSPRVRVWIGTWPSTSARLMRVPVTSTASRLVVDCAAAPTEPGPSRTARRQPPTGGGAGDSFALSKGMSGHGLPRSPAWRQRLLCKQAVKITA